MYKSGTGWKAKRPDVGFWRVSVMAFEAYRDRQYCLDELASARQIWGDKEKFTPERAERLAFALAGMYAFCPEDLQPLVLGTLNECHMRAALIHGIKTMVNTSVI
jgi:hypothetical protein